MTLRDILERAHCCDDLLAFADPASICQNCGARFDAPETDCPKPSAGKPYVDCGRGGHWFSKREFKTFGDLWHAIERHDWLTWLMRHCPDQFEDSWRDCVSALHAVADFATSQETWVSRQREACRLTRQYIRLRNQ